MCILNTFRRLLSILEATSASGDLVNSTVAGPDVLGGSDSRSILIYMFIQLVLAMYII
jgi:hypothetical protein